MLNTEVKNNTLHHGHYIKSIVYGGLDGIVTTFVVVAGAAGASLSTGVLLILGIGSMIGDAFSMGVGDYVSSQAENEFHETERRRLANLFDTNSTLEKRKIFEIYQENGLTIKDSHTVANILMKKKKTAVELMMLAEFGFVESITTPISKGFYTFFSFLFFGCVPLLAYVIELFVPEIHIYSFVVTIIFTVVTLFILGALKVTITEQNWFVSGFEMMCIGSFSAFIAYMIGRALSGLA